MLLGGVIILAFQNCGPASFTSQESPLRSLGTANFQEFTVETVTTTNQTDILFVVDESASMSAVLTPLRQGFESLASGAFPANARMAVTNMAPAFYLDPVNRTLDLTRSFYNNSTSEPFTQQPGFISLITRASINSFKTAQPTKASRFPLAGCDSAWFLPTEKNADNINCLTAHTQIALLGTGVEAGVITLDQLVNRHRTTGTRLFREGSLVNVIFVSDTHEPGATYFGRPGAPAEMFSYQSVTDNINTGNPGILGVKFHGIVPLPPIGHAALSGVNTVGVLPADLASAQVSSEQLHDFSYLPFVARSGGVAIHPVGNNWSAILPQVLRETLLQRSPLVHLQRPVARIRRVIANGVELPPSGFTLSSNRQDLQISAQLGWPQTITVRVEFDPAP
jgi:hypothetical protein